MLQHFTIFGNLLSETIKSWLTVGTQVTSYIPYEILFVSMYFAKLLHAGFVGQ